MRTLRLENVRLQVYMKLSKLLRMRKIYQNFVSASLTTYLIIIETSYLYLIVIWLLLSRSMEMLTPLRLLKEGLHTLNIQIVIVEVTKISLLNQKQIRVPITIMTSQWLLKLTIRIKVRREMDLKQGRTIKCRKRTLIQTSSIMTTKKKELNYLQFMLLQNTKVRLSTLIYFSV